MAKSIALEGFRVGDRDYGAGSVFTIIRKLPGVDGSDGDAIFWILCDDQGREFVVPELDLRLSEDLDDVRLSGAWIVLIPEEGDEEVTLRHVQTRETRRVRIGELVSSSERDPESFLAMRVFFLNPEAGTWSASEGKKGGVWAWAE